MTKEQRPRQSSIGIHEYRRLRSQARTAADFRALAQQCQSRSEFYRRSQSAIQAELAAQHVQSSPQSVVKHPTRGQSLKNLADSYGELSRQWEALGTECSGKAIQLEAARPE
jgi:hypothetical protein